MSNFGPVHVLEVTMLGDEEFDVFTVTHPPECNLVHDEHFKMDYYDCAVDEYIRNAGLKWSLKYSGYTITEPGTYRIQAWAETIRHFEGTEYDGGIALVSANKPYNGYTDWSSRCTAMSQMQQRMARLWALRMSRKQGEFCKHYTGLINKQCAAGVLYADVKEASTAGEGPHFPCIEGYEGTIACEKRLLPTPEQIAERKAALADYLDRLAKAIRGELRECLECGVPFERYIEVGRCVYAEPCNHRQWQGKAPRREQ